MITSAPSRITSSSRISPWSCLKNSLIPEYSAGAAYQRELRLLDFRLPDPIHVDHQPHVRVVLYQLGVW